MKTTYGQFIKHLREARGLTQAEVAEELAMSRSSYVALEKGTKELTLAESVLLVEFFDISLDELLRRQVPDLMKYRQTLLGFIREAVASNSVVKKTKLAKLLYLADFAWFYKYQESMSGMTYRKFAYGPVSDTYLSLIEEMEVNGELNITQVLREDYHMYEITETRASQKIKLNLLSREEKALVKTIWKKWQTSDTNEIVRFTQNQLPFTLAEDNGRLSYRAILKEEVAHIY